MHAAELSEAVSAQFILLAEDATVLRESLRDHQSQIVGWKDSPLCLHHADAEQA